MYGAAAGVCNATLGVQADCQEERGGVFDSAKSASWNQTYHDAAKNQYDLGLNTQLGENGVGQYGMCYCPAWVVVLTSQDSILLDWDIPKTMGQLSRIRSSPKSYQILGGLGYLDWVSNLRTSRPMQIPRRASLSHFTLMVRYLV